MKYEPYCFHCEDKKPRCTHCGAPATYTLTITDRNLVWAYACDKCYKEIYEDDQK